MSSNDEDEEEDEKEGSEGSEISKGMDPALLAVAVGPMLAKMMTWKRVTLGTMKIQRILASLILWSLGCKVARLERN